MTNDQIEYACRRHNIAMDATASAMVIARKAGKPKTYAALAEKLDRLVVGDMFAEIAA